MDDIEFKHLTDTLAQLLRPHLARSEMLRQAVTLLVEWLSENDIRVAASGSAPVLPIVPSGNTQTFIDAPAGPPSSLHVDSSATPVIAQLVSKANAELLPVSSEVVSLRIGGAVAQVPITGTKEEIGRARSSAIEPKPEPALTHADSDIRDEFDLSLIAKRCRLKANACRHYPKMRVAELSAAAHAAALHEMQNMIDEAKSLQPCFIWVFWRERNQPEDRILLAIAETYDAMADAVLVIHQMEESNLCQPDDDATALQLLAEAHSALRVALGLTWLSDPDRDQVETYRWLQRETKSRQIYLKRHMSIDDPADPNCAPDLRARVRQFEAKLNARNDRVKLVNIALNRIKYHAGQIEKKSAEDAVADWKRIEEAVVSLGTLGIAPSHRDIAEAVGSKVLGLLTTGVMNLPNLQSVAEYARARITASPNSLKSDAVSSERAWSPTVLEIRKRLSGTNLVIIGGEPDPVAERRIEDAFQLGEVEWVRLTVHGPLEPMKAPIFRTKTSVVIVLTRLAGHKHVEKARDWASMAGKPLVTLPSGFSPEQIAKAIHEQASARLKK